MSSRSLVAAIVMVAVLRASTALCQPQTPPLQSATIVEHLGNDIPRDATFTDSNGRAVALGSFIGAKPLVISLAYFTCPMLCHYGLDGAADGFQDSGWRLGRDFRAVTVSIDPRDRPETARTWRARAAARLGLAPDQSDWHFLVGEESEIRRLADALGFRYAYDRQTGQYAHATTLFVITTDGRIARYLYGISFAPEQVAAALRQAGNGQIGGPVERLLLRCYHYVPALRRHAEFVAWLLRLGGLAVVASLGTALLLLWRRDAARMEGQEP